MPPTISRKKPRNRVWSSNVFREVYPKSKHLCLVVTQHLQTGRKNISLDFPSNDFLHCQLSRGGKGESHKSDGNTCAGFILNWVNFFSVNNSKSEKESKRIVAFSLFGQKKLREGRKEDRSLLNVSSLSIARGINEWQSSQQTSIFPPQYPRLFSRLVRCSCHF